jgi:hypothetical protein
MTGLLSVLVFVMFGLVVGVTVWGWLSLPGSRFPVSLGVPPSVEGTVGKGVGLTLWLSISAILFAGSLSAARQSPGIAWIGAGLLAFFLFMEIHTIRRLRP